MNKSDIYRLADDLQEGAGRLAYPEVLEDADSGVSLGDQGQLWKEHKDRAGYHQLHVRPIHFIQAAKSMLRGVPLGFLKNVHSWKEVEVMYRAMYASSINPKSGYNSETAQDLELVANALKVAADGLQSHRNYKRKEPDTFDGWKNYFFCPFCWRLAPRVKRKQERPGRCSVHEDVQSPATRRARRLRDYIAPKYKALPHAKIKNAFNIEFKKTKIDTAPFHHIKSIIHSDVYNQVMYPSPSFDPAIVPIEKMSTKRIWSFFPHAAEYAYQHGADLNNLYSAVKALDDDVDPTGMRERIHIAYSRAPILAEDFLLNAEVWLHLETQKRWRGKQRIHS